jgi:hypothetical protein
LFISGFVFFITGISSWNSDFILSYFYISEIQFIPQGFVICFYGSLAVILSLYLFFNRFLSIGSGFNEYNKEKKQIIIFRWGKPGKNRRFKLLYSFNEIDSLSLENQNPIFNIGKFNLYLLLNNQKKILLIRSDVTNIYTVQEIEYFSAKLAQFLQIPFKRNF